MCGDSGRVADATAQLEKLSGITPETHPQHTKRCPSNSQHTLDRNPALRTWIWGLTTARDGSRMSWEDCRMDPIEVTAELGGMGPGYYQGLTMWIAIFTLILVGVGILVQWLIHRHSKRGRERERKGRLLSCTIAVNNEVLQNRSYLESLKEYQAIHPTPGFRLSSVSYESFWRAFVETAMSGRFEEGLQKINRLYHEYERINRQLDTIRELIAARVLAMDTDLFRNLGKLVDNVLTGGLEKEALEAVEEIRADLQRQVDALS